MTEVSGPELEPSRRAAPHSWAGSGLPARLRAAWQGLETAELVSVLALLTLCVGIRLLKLQPIEYYDDEVTRWHFVRQWFYPNEFQHAQWTHHMARVGLNLPLFLVQLLFGSHASAYYVWPVASFTLQVLLTYLTAKRLGGRSAGLLAGVFLCVFTGMDRGASQILPDAFGATAMILVCYLLTRYQEAQLERRMLWLVAAGLSFVWAYEIKESNLLFVPGTAAAVWLAKGRFRDGVLFGVIVLAAIAVETLVFRIFTDYPSRFAIVSEAHGDITTTFLGLFDRFTRMEASWQMLFWMWVPAALWLLGSDDKRLRVLVLMPAGFLFFITFLVRSVDPIVVWTRYYSRYFEPLAPLLVAAVALFVVDALRRAWRALAPAKLAGLPRWFSNWAGLTALTACALVGLLEVLAVGHALPSPALSETLRISRIVNDAYRRNLPIVHRRAKRNEPEERRTRALKAVYGIYLNPDLLVTSDLAKHGWLPNILDALRYTKRYAYVVHDGSAYRNDAEVERWVADGCAVTVTEAKGHLNAALGVPSLIVEHSDKLPERCRPPER